LTRRLAACCALIVFAFCVVQGMLAHNSFSTTVSRALQAMGVTFALGLVIGWVAQTMLDENLKAEETKLREQSEGVSANTRK
jgi:NhaP-type Na+/H+ or K+/H+ antiporter